MFQAARDSIVSSARFKMPDARSWVVEQIQSGVMSDARSQPRASNTDSGMYHWYRVACGRSAVGNGPCSRVTAVTELSGRSRHSAAFGHLYSGCYYRGEHATFFHLRLPLCAR